MAMLMPTPHTPGCYRSRSHAPALAAWGVLTVLALLSVLVLQPLALASAATPELTPPAFDPFQRTWARTDQPVADGSVARTWMWGPEPISAPLQEPYAESPGGERTVVYYDKSRMEVTHPDAVDDGVWYVTNGLLARELITGEMQTGDNQWDYRLPAQINVVGDQGIENGPTYATLRERVQTDPINLPPPGFVGDLITSSMDTAGRVLPDDPRYAAYDVRIGAVGGVSTPDGAPTHAIAAPFWEFMHSRGLVSIDGALVEDRLFPDAFYATGLPLTAPYWTTASVGGTLKDVLFQCFERRCLTYTPDNPIGWKVESGNVGQHYQQWRNSQPQSISGEILFTRTHWADHDTTSGLYLINADGTNERALIEPLPGTIEHPRWSPDGTHVAFIVQQANVHLGRLILLNVATGELQQLLPQAPMVTSFDWAPDSTRLAIAATRQGQWPDVSMPSQIFVVSLAAPDDVQQVTGLTAEAELYSNFQPAWSPDGEWIAYGSDGWFNSGSFLAGVARIRPDGSGQETLVAERWPSIASLAWTNDGATLLLFRTSGSSRDVSGGSVWRVTPDENTGEQLLVGCDTAGTGCAGSAYLPRDLTTTGSGSDVALTIMRSHFYAAPDRYLYGGPAGIAVLDSHTGVADQILAYGSELDWSPDGEHLAFKHQRHMSHHSPQQRIGITSRDGSVQWLVVNDASQPQWRPVPTSAP